MPDAVTDAGTTGGALANAGKAVVDAGSQAVGSVGDFVKNHPYLSTAGVGATGLLAGVLLHNLRKNKNQ